MSRLVYKTAIYLMALLFIGAVYYSYQVEIKTHQAFQTTHQNIAIKTILDSYRRVVSTIFEEVIDQPDIINSIDQANGADEKNLNIIRGRLYRKLYKTYKRLRKQDIRVLQFVLANGNSLIRFNRPDLFGDNIVKDRPMLAEVLKGQFKGGILENGRVYPGFRYAFPLFKNGKVVGVADFSVSFDAISRLMTVSESNTQTANRFIINRALLEQVSHPSSKTLFLPSAINDQYIIEDTSSSLRDIDNKIPIPQVVFQLDRMLQTNQQVQTIINSGEAGSNLQCLGSRHCYIIDLFPVADSQGRTAAYIVSYVPSFDIFKLRIIHLVALIIGLVLLFFAGSVFKNWIASRQRLVAITNNMAEGMYVMDGSGKMIYVNPTTVELLGFTEKEMIGQGAHDLFHYHSDNKKVHARDCPILTETIKGNVFKSDSEVFKCKNGQLKNVNVVSSPLKDGDVIRGTVVLFHDITEEAIRKIRLQQADIAFQNIAEAIIVTDTQSNILAVNAAFCNITGYTEEEALNHNPRILKSGKNSAEFYQNMWNDIKNIGSWEGEIWNRKKDGSIYPEYLHIASIYDQEQQVIGYVGTFSDVTEKKIQEEQLKQLAYHDQLTGLYNRNYFLELFEHTLHHAERRDSKLALLYLDLDRFKSVNDSLGHIVGDKLLEIVARRIELTLREDDIVARLGGDEFVILLEDIHQNEQPARIASYIMAAIHKPIEIHPHVLHVTASIGISIYPQDGLDLTNVLKNADSAMYVAKRMGRNQYHYFTEAMAEEAEKRFKIENELHVALSREEFAVYYQPKIDLKTGVVVGLEALIRWDHPVRGILEPADFIDVAHDAGIMQDITKWLITTVAGHIKQWLIDGVNPGRVAINIDSQTFNTIGFSHELANAIAVADISADYLELEIPEKGLLAEHLNTLFWDDIVKLGFSLSIDDFGTGESSLFRLKHLPVSTLKIDKSFVKDIESDQDDRSIIKTIIAMGKILGKRVLAEGVENPQQLVFLHQMGCDEIQGYLFSKPVSVCQIPTILNSNEFNHIITTSK